MRILMFVIVMILLSCTLTPKEIEAPANLIPKDSMVLILHDLSILESYIHQKHVQLERYALLLRNSGDSLLADYGVSRERYENSLDYYGKNPEQFIEIYDAVLLKMEGGKVNPSPNQALENYRQE